MKHIFTRISHKQATGIWSNGYTQASQCSVHAERCYTKRACVRQGRVTHAPHHGNVFSMSALERVNDAVVVAKMEFYRSSKLLVNTIYGVAHSLGIQHR